MTPVKKTKAKTRLARDLQRTSQIMHEIVSGDLDPYLGYRELYMLYCRRTGLHEELRAFFTIPGIEPDGMLHVDDDFRLMVRNLAERWIKERDPSRSVNKRP